MALARLKVWGIEQLTDTDLNAEFNNILNNALSLISPLTGNLNCNSRQLTNLLFETQAASQTAANEGRVYYQTTEDQVHVDDGTNIRRVPTIASVARGDMIYASATSQWARLALGAAGRVLRSDGTDIGYSTFTIPNTYSQGDILYASAANTLTALAAGTSGQVLQTQGAGANPQWAAAGVALGDSPTWTATHTWSGAGARIQMSNADSMILVGTTTDPGWTVPAIQLNRGGMSGQSTTASSFVQNQYWDGAWKAIATGTSCQFLFTGNQMYWYTAASASAGAAVTNTEQMALDGATGGFTVGAPWGSFKGVGTINVADDIYKNNSAYTNPDYVFEDAFRARPLNAPEGWRRRSLQELEAYARLWFHLPGTHPDNPMGIFDRGDWVLEKLEEAFLHLFDHEQRLSALEARVA